VDDTAGTVCGTAGNASKSDCSKPLFIGEEVVEEVFAQETGRAEPSSEGGEAGEAPWF